VDNNPACKPDELWDLCEWGKRWPWQNVHHITIKHFIEHISHGTGKDGLIRFFERCWHILKPGGTIECTFPWYTSIGAFSDPTHRRFITPMTFSYLSREWLRSRKIEHYDMACDFQVVSVVAKLAEGMEELTVDQQSASLQGNWNAAHEGVAVLRAIK
jgi:predicted SAM-dependent methyltransferase